jgi:hypothetical protein
LDWKLWHKEFFLRCEMKLPVLCLFAVFTAGAQSTTEHLPVTDAGKIADALRAAPNFKTDGATIVDYPASKGGEFRVLRKGNSEWTCPSGPPAAGGAAPTSFICAAPIRSINGLVIPIQQADKQ